MIGQSNHYFLVFCINLLEESPTKSEKGNNNNIANESPLVELISSIRRIAGTLEMPRSRDSSPHHFDSSNSSAANNWSQSLLRAANVICEKIATNSTTNSEGQLAGEINKQNIGNKAASAAANLPPRPPPPQQSAAKTTTENDEWKLFTPQLMRRRNNFVEGNGKVVEKIKILKKGEEDKTEAAYRKFIYNGPLKAVNNNNNNNKQQKVERKSRESARLMMKGPRSASSQPSSNGLVDKSEKEFGHFGLLTFCIHASF